MPVEDVLMRGVINGSELNSDDSRFRSDRMFKKSDMILQILTLFTDGMILDLHYQGKVLPERCRDIQKCAADICTPLGVQHAYRSIERVSCESRLPFASGLRLFPQVPLKISPNSLEQLVPQKGILCQENSINKIQKTKTK